MGGHHQSCSGALVIVSTSTPSRYLTAANVNIVSSSELFYAILNIISLAYGSTFEFYSSLAKFISYTSYILSWFFDVSQALTFLALFYLARAITLLRVDETSKRYRIGKIVSLGAVVLISVLSFVAMCLWISTREGYYSWGFDSDNYERVMMRRQVAQIFDLICGIVNLLCAIGAVTYIALVRKNALKGPLHKVSFLLPLPTSLSIEGGGCELSLSANIPRLGLEPCACN